MGPGDFEVGGRAGVSDLRVDRKTASVGEETCLGDHRVDREASLGKNAAGQRTNCGNFRIDRETSLRDCSTGRRGNLRDFRVDRGAGVGGSRVNFYSAQTKKLKK